MRRGTGIIIAACGAAAVAVILLLLTGATGKGDGPTPTPTPSNGVEHGVFGRVIDQAGNPIHGVTVHISGPFDDGEAHTKEGLTNETGQYLIGLHADGEFEVLAFAEGFETSLLSPRNMQVPPVEGLTGFPDIVLRRTTEPPVVTPGSNGFVYGQGVECKLEDATRVLMTHGIVNSASEIEQIFEDSMVGQGWSTFVRDGHTISVVPITYTNEPACHVILKDKHRADGLVHVFLQKKCGNVSSPPGVPISKPTPPPGKEVTPTATNTPPAGSTPTPTATKTPMRTSTPVTPSATATSTPRSATQTPAPTQVGCCTPDPDHTRPAVTYTPVNTVVHPTDTPMPTQTTKAGPIATHTPSGGGGCGYFGC